VEPELEMERILVVDDEPLARQRLTRMITRAAPMAEVREAPDGDAAVEAIRSWRPDAVFLDIQMPGRDGFAVVEAVGVHEMPPAVFVTAYDQHALKAFEVAAVDYLLKPFDDERFEATWSRVLRRHASAQLAGEARRLGALLAAVGSTAAGAVIDASGAKEYAQRFLVKVGEKTNVVPVSEVRWLQSDGNYVDLHTATGTHTIRETLANVEQRLDPRRFVRIHRRVIVAIEQIKEIQPWFGGDQILILKDASKLRVSRTRREFVATRLAGIAG
jgi:two-component system LytT family response regulator